VAIDHSKDISWRWTGTNRGDAGDADCDPVNDELFGMDGIAFDVHGDQYAAMVLSPTSWSKSNWITAR